MNFGIIGCGVISASHAKALEKIEGSRLYAVCDIVEDKAIKLAEAHSVSQVYTSHHGMLADPDVDIVCVCVPSGIHGEICIDAAKAGKAIVCEKPMEITPEKIQEVIDAVEANSVKMQCIFQRRTMPVAIAVKELVSSGGLGKIYTAEADLRYYRSQAYYNSAGWRGTWDLDGGGALMNQGVHGVDLILWMLGDEIESLYGAAETLGREIDVEDSAAAILRMKKGAICTILSTTTTYPGFSTAFRISGEKGTVAFDDNGIVLWEFIDPDQAPPRPDDLGEAVGGHKNPGEISALGHEILLSDIAAALRQGREPMIPPREATLAVRVICGIYESQKKRAEIR